MGKSARNQSRGETKTQPSLGSVISISSLFGDRSQPKQAEADRARAQGTLAEIIHARKAGGKAAQSAKIREIMSRG